MQSMVVILKHEGLDKMAVILQTAFSNAFSRKKRVVFWFQFQWSLFLVVQIDGMQVLVHVRTWYRTDDRPLSKPMLNCWQRLTVQYNLTTPQWVTLRMEIPMQFQLWNASDVYKWNANKYGACQSFVASLLARENWAIVGTGNGLIVRWKAITSANADLFSFH